MHTANPIHLARIDHVVIRARDVKRLLGFYVDVLGCTPEREQRELGLYQLRAGRSLIDLVDVAGPIGGRFAIPDRHAPNMDHFCLSVAPWDGEAILAHLAAHGLKGLEIAPRYGAEGTGPSIYLEDPEGNSLELKGPPPA